MSENKDAEQVRTVLVSPDRLGEIISNAAQRAVEAVDNLDDVLIGEAVSKLQHLSNKGNYSIDGVGPDAPTVTNEKGARQSATPYRFDLLPPLALAAVAKVLSPGAEKYGEWNWLGIKAEDHLNHALQHIVAHMAGDKSEDHASHAACRILMWYDKLERDRQDARTKGE